MSIRAIAFSTYLSIQFIDVACKILGTYNPQNERWDHEGKLANNEEMIGVFGTFAELHSYPWMYFSSFGIIVKARVAS